MISPESVTLTLVLNGYEVTRTGPGHFSLLQWLREVVGAHEVKYGCGEGVCGACTVLVNGELVSSCLVLAAQVSGAEVRTVVGLLEDDGELGELQRAFLEYGAAQCGFCTPGMLLAAAELLERGVPVDRPAIREALHGNLCRCTGYRAIVDAVSRVAAKRGILQP